MGEEDYSKTWDPMESHLIRSVNDYLDLHLVENSIFLCERLVAQFPKEENLVLLATCYHRSGQIYRAYHLLKGITKLVSIPLRNLTSDAIFLIHHDY